MDKKIYAIIILTSLIIAGTMIVVPPGYDEYKYTFVFEQPEFINVETEDGLFKMMNLKNCVSTGEVGDPELKYYHIQYLLPNNKEIDKINIEAFDRTEICLNKPIVPLQEDITCNDTPIFVINELTYLSNKKIMNRLFEIGDIGYMRGYPLISINIYPIDYIPSENKIIFYNNLTLSFKFKDSENTQSNGYLRNNEADKDYISNVVYNLDTIESYDDAILDEYIGGLCDPSDTYDYVIITNNALKNPTGCLYDWNDLMDLRETKNGLSCTIVTIEEIDAVADYWSDDPLFNDTQAHMREFCKDAYQDWGTIYILIGGKWMFDPVYQAVPYRLFTDASESHTYDDMACDKYFSHLDGDWYYDYKQIWGGGKGNSGQDRYGELIVGRLAVWNAASISNCICKILQYESNYYDTDYLSRASFWGGDLGWYITSKAYMEEIRLGTDTYRVFEGFEEWNADNPDSLIDTTERIYHADLGVQTGTYMWESVENDNSSFINHDSHSSWNSPIGLWGWSYHYNSKPFMAVSQGCLSGRYHSGFSGCEQLMCNHPNKFAHTLILNIGYGYGSTGSTNGAGQYIHAYYVDYFFDEADSQDDWQVGKAFFYTSDKMGSYSQYRSSAWTYNWYSTHLFGDPALTYKVKYHKQIIELNPGVHDLIWDSPIETTLKDIAINTSLSPPEYVGKWHTDFHDWEFWIPGYTPDSLNRVIRYGDRFIIGVSSTKYLVM